MALHRPWPSLLGPASLPLESSGAHFLPANIHPTQCPYKATESLGTGMRDKKFPSSPRRILAELTQPPVIAVAFICSYTLRDGHWSLDHNSFHVTSTVCQQLLSKNFSPEQARLCQETLQDNLTHSICDLRGHQPTC